MIIFISFPIPEIPPLWLLPRLLVDGLVICLVAFSINMSMAKILAKKAANYSVSANQELLAGVGIFPLLLISHISISAAVCVIDKWKTLSG